MIGTTTLHLDWQPKQGENEFCHTKLTPEIIKKGRSAIRVRIAAAEEEKERENEEMEVLLVKPRQSVLVPEKEKMPLMKAITELGSEDDDTLVFSRSQMEEYLREAADTNPSGRSGSSAGVSCYECLSASSVEEGLDEGTDRSGSTFSCPTSS